MYIRRAVNLWKSTAVKAHSHTFDPLRCTNENHILNITCFYTAGTQRVILVFFIYCMSCMFSLSCELAWTWFFSVDVGDNVDGDNDRFYVWLKRHYSRCPAEDNWRLPSLPWLLCTGTVVVSLFRESNQAALIYCCFLVPTCCSSKGSKLTSFNSSY